MVQGATQPRHVVDGPDLSRTISLLSLEQPWNACRELATLTFLLTLLDTKPGRDGCTTSPHGWRVPNHLRLLCAPYTRGWHDHRSLDWRKSACCSPGAVAAQRARGSKNTHGCVPRVYSYGHICHGRRGPERPLKAVSACSMKNLSKVIARKSPARDKG